MTSNSCRQTTSIKEHIIYLSGLVGMLGGSISFVFGIILHNYLVYGLIIAFMSMTGIVIYATCFEDNT
jgi:hypothetical protein